MFFQILTINGIRQSSFLWHLYHCKSKNPQVFIIVTNVLAMPHWSCSSALCFNNHKSLDQNGEKIRKYKLPTDPETREAYRKLFKSTTSFNWDKGFICSAHWSSGVRKSTKDLPDVVLPTAHYQLLKSKFIRAKHTFQHAEKPTRQQRRTYKNAQARL